jgi:hypothetical protein
MKKSELRDNTNVWREYIRLAKEAKKSGKKFRRDLDKVANFLSLAANETRAPWEFYNYGISPLDKKNRKSEIKVAVGKLNRLLEQTEDSVRWDLFADKWYTVNFLLDKLIEDAFENV